MLLHLAGDLCPELLRGEGDQSVASLKSLVVGSSCDIVGIREGAPRLDTDIFSFNDAKIPVVYNYG